MNYFKIDIEKPTHWRKQTASKTDIDWKVQKVVRNKNILLTRFWRKLKLQQKKENEEGTKKKSALCSLIQKNEGRTAKFLIINFLNTFELVINSFQTHWEQEHKVPAWKIHGQCKRAVFHLQQRIPRNFPCVCSVTGESQGLSSCWNHFQQGMCWRICVQLKIKRDHKLKGIKLLEIY